MKPLGEKLISWNCYFIVCPTCLIVETTLPKVLNVKIYTIVVELELHCAKPGKKHILNKQYVLLSQLCLLTRVYGRSTSQQLSLLCHLSCVNNFLYQPD